MAVALILGFFILLAIALAIASAGTVTLWTVVIFGTIFALGGGSIVAMAKLLEDADAGSH